MNPRAKPNARPHDPKPPAARPPAAAKPARPVHDVQEMRRSLMLKLAMFASDWRRCPRRVCRRRRACTPHDGHCLCRHDDPAPMTPDQVARMNADLLRAARRRLAEIAGGGGCP